MFYGRPPLDGELEPLDGELEPLLPPNEPEDRDGEEDLTPLLELPLLGEGVTLLECFELRDGCW
jgi:hypothetical protein